MKTTKYFILLWSSILLYSCSQRMEVRHGSLCLQMNDLMHTRILMKNEMVFTPQYQASEYLVGKGFEARDFVLSEFYSGKGDTPFWKTLAIARGNYFSGKIQIEKEVNYLITDSLPDFLLVKVRYINKGSIPLEIERWVNQAYTLPAQNDEPAFWTFQGSSDPSRHDWIMPLDTFFYRENYMGMNASDYGGGVPMVDVWRRDGGLAIGHASLHPEQVSFPVETDSAVSKVKISVTYKFSQPLILKPGDTLYTIPTWIQVHTGDCFVSLRRYSRYLHFQGLQFPASEPAAFEPVWCAWGYGRNATRDEILKTLPKVKELGFLWVDIDDGYQQAEGDWELDRKKYPHGDVDMRSLVDQIHSAGLKAKIWWAPLAVDSASNLFNSYPEIALINEKGKYQDISWWDSYYMSPLHPLTLSHTQFVLQKFLTVWDFDGLKVDGQHINCVPPDYNSAAGYKTPDEAPARLPEFFERVWQTSRKLKPHAVVQLCPCGSVMSVFHLPYMNQAVASDPLSSWQIRTKAFVYKALAPHLAYYGDHVELSTGGLDFASQIGVGGVPGSKFTWPADHPGTQESFLLTPEKEAVIKNWVSLYRNKMLSMGEYLGGLYDIGYDRPETHVICKSDTLYYAFYSPVFEGVVPLKGLKKGMKYQVYDYENSHLLGVVSSDQPNFRIAFTDHLLIELIPISFF